jgi:ABC-type branched-subunit amino acid transport system substrate-binding protein
MYKLFAWAAMALSFQSAGAQDKGDILVGMSLPLIGFNAAAGKEGLATATAYVDSVNKAGGIGRRKIVLRVLDDEFVADKAAENA